VAFKRLEDVDAKLAAKQKALHAVFTEAGKDMDLSEVKSVSGGKDAVLDFIRSANEELDALGKERDECLVLQKGADRVRDLDTDEGPGESDRDLKGHKAEVKSLGEHFTASAAYKARDRRETAHLDIEVKTLFERTTGWTPETNRTGRVVDYVTRPLQLTDVVPVGSTNQTSVVYMEETTFTNAATEVAEGGTYPEGALGLTEKSSPVQKISVFIPVTDEQLEDQAGAASYVDRRLRFMVAQRLDSQLLVGNGTAPNLRGILNVVGIQTQARGTDPAFDAIFKALTKVRVVGRAIPGAVVLHSTDWQNIRLARTADGIYILGNPDSAGSTTIFGQPVVQQEVGSAGTALVGDFQNYSELAVRRGVDVQVSNSHGTYFIEGKQAVRADLRAALVVYRPTAFCTVTGL